MAADYRTPKLKIPYEEALAHRLRRIYLPVLTVVLPAWMIRTTALDPVGMPTSAAIGVLPGWPVLAAVVLDYLVALVVGFRPRTWKGHPKLRAADIGRWQED